LPSFALPLAPPASAISGSACSRLPSFALPLAPPASAISGSACSRLPSFALPLAPPASAISGSACSPLPPVALPRAPPAPAVSGHVEAQVEGLIEVGLHAERLGVPGLGGVHVGDGVDRGHERLGE